MKPRTPFPLRSPAAIRSQSTSLRGGCSQRKAKGASAGFSLVEVIVAVGIFAVAVVAVLGVLPLLARNSTESADALVAQRLPAAVEAELHRAAAATGFDVIGLSIPLAITPLENGAAFVASRDGVRLVPIAESAGLITAGHGYFLVEVWRFPSEPLAFVTGSAALATQARVTWPFRLPGSVAATPFRERNQFNFGLAINR